jgi:hypothetical protein
LRNAKSVCGDLVKLPLLTFVCRIKEEEDDDDYVKNSAIVSAENKPMKTIVCEEQSK